MNILMTGASGAIGQALAIALAKEGHSLVVVSRKAVIAKELLAKLSDDNQQHHQYVVADITETQGRGQIHTFIEELASSENQKIDTLINLAGVNEFVGFKSQSEAAIEQIINTNLTSTMLLTQQLLMHFGDQKKATIINVGSTLGAIGHPGYATYCASKFALRGFSEALDRELANSPVQVRYFAPRTTQSLINSVQAVAMNKALGNKVDTVDHVVTQFILFLNNNNKQLHLGWPEKLFVKINGLLPDLVSVVLRNKLPTIKQYII